MKLLVFHLVIKQLTVEPGIYLEGEFGVRLEDTVSISKKGNVIGDLPLNID